MILLLLFFVIHIYYNKAGIVRPDNPTPIVPYRNNEQALGQYLFYVSFDTPISNNAHI